MSIDSYRSSLNRLTSQAADIQKKIGAEQRKVGELRRDVSRLRSEAVRATSASTRSSRERAAEGKERDLARAEDRLGSLMRDKSRVDGEITRVTRTLESAEDRARRERDQRDARRRDTEVRHARELTREAERQARISAQMPRGELVIRFAGLPEKITVLFAAANPLDTDRLRLDAEIRGITERIRASEHREAIGLESRWALRPPDLLQALNELRPHVIHFSGHGNERSIAFENASGDAVEVGIEALVELMRVMTDNIRLVVFNVCESEQLAEDVSRHVEAAIGMRGELDDDAAAVFAAAFYSAIGFGRSLDEAFAQARAALMLEFADMADVPVLFFRSDVDPSEVVLVKPI